MTTQSNRSRWILIGGLIVLMIAAFALIVVSRVDIVMNTFFNRTDRPESVTAHYYEAIRNQNYAAAYTDLDDHATLNGQSFDEQSFIRLATEADAQRGSLVSYGILKQASDASRFNASLWRGDRSYTVHIQLRQVGDRWKIISLDDL